MEPTYGPLVRVRKANLEANMEEAKELKAKVRAKDLVGPVEDRIIKVLAPRVKEKANGRVKDPGKVKQETKAVVKVPEVVKVLWEM